MPTKIGGRRGGEYRKQMYQVFQNILERPITSEEHVLIRAILKNYVNARTADYQQKIKEQLNIINELKQK